MEIQNLMEEEVKAVIDELFEIESSDRRLGYCTCRQCRLDVEADATVTTHRNPDRDGHQFLGLHVQRLRLQRGTRQATERLHGFRHIAAQLADVLVQAGQQFGKGSTHDTLHSFGACSAA